MVRKLRLFLKSIPSSLNILATFLDDAIRFIKFNENNKFFRTKEKEKALLIRACHGIEKAFSLPNIKKEFGYSQARVLLNQIKKYHRNFGEDDYLYEGMNILNNYFEHHKKIDSLKVKKLNEDFYELEKQIHSFVYSDCYEILEPQSSIEFETYKKFFLSRFSVRDFLPKKIEIDKIQEILQVASNTSSACNRQPWLTRVYLEKSDILKALSVQNGNRGFSDSIHHLILVTGVISNFKSTERNQAYIDCGSYCQSLVLAMHAQGISACMLNLSNDFFIGRKMRKVLKLESFEVPIMMIAFGYSDKPQACKSLKKDLSEYVHFIDND